MIDKVEKITFYLFILNFNDRFTDLTAFTPRDKSKFQLMFPLSNALVCAH